MKFNIYGDVVLSTIIMGNQQLNFFEDFENIIKNFKEGSSTTIEKYNCYFIKKGNLINDNKKYYIY